MNTPSQPPQPDETELPPGLRQALREFAENPVPIPGELDRVILKKAKAHLQNSSILLLPTLHPVASWLTAAAALILAGWLTFSFVPAVNQRFASPSKLEDLDRNGLVDIRDAFWLARKLEADPSALDLTQFDINRDGLVDQQDVDAIAYRAVSLEEKS